MDAQLPIKVLIIASFIGFAVFIILPSRGSRSSAIRRLILAFLLLSAVLAVVFPNVLGDFASLLGVGRGTDLLLYVFIVVLVGQILSHARQRRFLEERITQLARLESLRSVKNPKNAVGADESTNDG